MLSAAVARATPSLVSGVAEPAIRADLLPQPVLPHQVRFSKYSGSRYLTKGANGDAAEIAAAYVRSNASSLGVTRDDLTDLVVVDRYTDADTGVTHVYFRQRYQGIEVAGADVGVHVTRDGRVLYVGGALVGGLRGKAEAARAAALRPDGASAPVSNGGASALAADQALTAAAAQLGLKSQRPASFTRAPRRHSVARDARLSAPGVSLDEVPARLHYVPLASGGLRLAWELVLRTPGGKHWYQMSVDGANGKVLAAVDWADRLAAYRVYPAPTRDPQDGVRTLVTDPQDPAASPFGWHDTDGIVGNEFTDTRGNNVWAQEDADANDTGGYRPTGTYDGDGQLTFDFPTDLTKSPAANRDAAVTNLFYWTNLLHDVHASYGFTEAAGNFQVTNYSGAGAGGDALLADAQDGSSLNDSTFITPPDGQSPRMQMFLFDATTPGRDGAFDASLIAHEYGHGVATRLTGGPSNSDSLAAIQSAAMGEGWGDWWALMFTLKSGDTGSGRHPIGTYVLGQDPLTANGLRKYAYSIDKTVDPLTYASIKSSSESHDAGQIWGSALWDLTWKLIGKYGYDSDWGHGYDASNPTRDGGNNLALKLVMDALKLQPSNPSFLAGRDAILAADVALTGGANAREIWTAFAGRGMGVSAADGGSADATNVTEAFDLPTSLRAPVVRFQSPPSSNTPPTKVSVTFTERMDPTTFSVADDVVSFTSPTKEDHKGDITGFTWLNYDTVLQINFTPQTIDGNAYLVLGPQILAADDHAPLDQDGDGVAGEAVQDAFTARVNYDSVTLAVTSTGPANSSLVTLPLTTIDVNFNEPIDPASLQPGDLFVSRGTVTAATAVDADTARFTVGGVTGETPLSFTLKSFSVTDVNGNGNSSAYTSSVTVDNGAVPFTGTWRQVLPSGSMIFTGSASTNLSFAGDVDAFTLDLQAGQSFRATMSPARTLTARFDVFDPQGYLISTSAPDVLTPTTYASAPGTYRLVVTSLNGSTGTARVTVDLNATTETEVGGSGPAQDLDGAFQPIAPGATADRASVWNGLMLNGDSQDAYTFDLAAGQHASIAIYTSFLDAPKLIGPDGRLMSLGTRNVPGVTWSVSDFVAPVGGTYRVELTSNNQTSYTLAVTRGAGFQSENNNALASAYPIPSSGLGDSRFIVGNLVANSSEYFRIEARAGDVLRFQTRTPGDAAIAPENLDPKLVLFGTNMAQVAMEDNSAGDGRNALITYTAPAGGVYYLQLQGATTASSGNYLLESAGTTVTSPVTSATVSSPTNGALLKAIPTTLQLAFSDAVLLTSLDPADLLVDGIATTGLTVVDGTTVKFNVPAGLAEGTHTITMAAGAVTDIHGNPVAGLSSSFSLDLTPPTIISSSIHEGDVLPSLQTSELRLQFSEPVSAYLQDPGDFRLLNTTLGIPAPVTPSYDAATNTLIFKSWIDDGDQTFTLKGYRVADAAGNLMSGDFVVHFKVDSVTTPFLPLAPLKPLGSTVYGSAVFSVISTTTDSDSYTLDLEAGQLLTINGTPGSGLLQTKIVVRDPSGTIVKSGMGAGQQTGALLNAIPIKTTGTYTITVTGVNGSIGSCYINLFVNATAPTTLTFNPLPAQPGRSIAAAFGYAQQFSTTTYNLTLNGGESADLRVSPNTPTALGDVQIFDASGVQVGKTIRLSNGVYKAAIQNGATAATYQVKVLGAAQYLGDVFYTLAIAKNAGFETEPNLTNTDANTFDAATTNGTKVQLGYVETGGDEDRYMVRAVAGQALTFDTATPGDGPSSFRNTLDPALALYDSTGKLLATDDNSASDGRNAHLVYTPTDSGPLYLVVRAAQGTHGEYALSVAGDAPAAFTASIVPADGSHLTAIPATVFVTFNDIVDLRTASAADLQVDGLPATAVTSTGPSTLSFTLPSVTSQGPHTLSIAAGAISSLRGTPLSAVTNTVTLDSIAPRVISSSIQKGDVVPTGDVTVGITFDEPVNPALVDPGDVTLRGAVRATNYTPDSIALSPDHTVLTVTYKSLPEDKYTLTLVSNVSSFVDSFNNALDGETTAATWPIGPNKSGNGVAGGNFVVDFSTDPAATIAFPAPLPTDGQSGSLAYTGSASGVLHGPADGDTYALSLAAGQRLTARLSTAGAFRGTLTVLDPSGASLGTFTATSTTAPLLVQRLPVATPGTYRVVVATADTGSGAYTLDLDLNAVRELESNGGTTNDTPATAQALTLAPVGGSPRVGQEAVYGVFDSTSSSADYYSIDLAAGDAIGASLTAVSTGNTLVVVDAFGLVLASAPSGFGLTAVLPTFTVPADGTYFVKVAGSAGKAYQLAVTRGAAFEVEPNDTIFKPQTLSGVPVAVGRIAAGGTYEVHDAEGFEDATTLDARWSTYSSRPQGEVFVSSIKGAAAGRNALLMDNAANDAVPTLNEATFTVDLTDRPAAQLSFATASFGDELHAMTADFVGHFNGDGVSISDDGVRWHPVWTPPSSQPAGWSTYTIDLAAEAAKAGMRLGAGLRIRFQQYDDMSLSGGDGRGWDAILVSTARPNPDYYALDLAAGETVTLRTSTPTTGPGAVGAPLDPRLDLYDLKGLVAASDTNSAPDGRNAVLSFTAPAAGRYVVAVSASTFAMGDYVLDASDRTNPPTVQPNLTMVSDSGLSGVDRVTRLNNATPDSALSFTVLGVTPGATVTLTLDGVELAPVTAAGTSVTVSTDGKTLLADGAHAVTARQQVAGQSPSPESAMLVLTIDATSPNTPAAPKLQAASDTDLPGDNVTTLRTPTFDITPVAGAYYRVYLNGVRVGGDYLTAASFTTPTLPDGAYTLTTAAVDVAGNESPQSAPVSFRVVPSAPPAPTVPIDLDAGSDSGASATDNITNVSSPILNLPAGLNAFRVFVNGVPTATTPLTGTTYTLPPLADGVWTLTYSVFDSAGVESGTGGKLTLTVDTLAPTTLASIDLIASSDLGESATDNLTADNTPTFSLNSAPYYRVYRDGTLVTPSYATGQYTSPILADGTYAFTSTTVDAAGNESAPTGVLAVTISTVRPAAPTVAPDLAPDVDSGVSDSDNITNVDYPYFLLPPGLHNVTVYHNGLPGGIMRDPGNSFFVTRPDDGKHTWAYTVSDAAGNESPMSPILTVTIDRVGTSTNSGLGLLPASDTGNSNRDGITRDNTPTFGIFSPLDYFRVLRNNVPISGLWETGSSFTCPPLPDGLAAYDVISYDAAGNRAVSSYGQDVMIDTNAPVSAVQPLPATVPAGPVTVNWGGTDTAPDGGAGSGVIWYEVYLSVDNGPYTIWHLASSYTSDTYTVETGHSYRFYSIACDLAGNVEAPPTNPDAATSVGLTPPTVLSASYDQDAPVPTSGGRYVAVRFSANVRDSLDLSDITITNLTTGQNITPKSMPYDDATNAAILYLGNDVPDGNYALKLYAPGIFNNVGVELDGNADGSPGGDALLPFFSFGGDANRDRVVDFNDLVKLAQNYNSSGKTWADGDFTGDGNVDFNDLVILAQHYNTSLSGAALPGPATSFSSDVAAAFALAAPKPAPIPAIPRRFTAAKPIPAVVVHPPVAKAPSPVRAAPPSPVQVAPPVFGNKRIKPRPNVQALFV